MSGQIYSLQDNRKFVASHNTEFEEQSGLDQELISKALALSGMLQTTLEIKELITLFFKQVNRIIEFDGLHYEDPEQDQREIALGLQSGHNCSYQLLVASDDLGTLKFFRSSRFQEQELETIENLLVGILYPLRNALLYQKAKKSAMLDPLTGAKNRTAMDSSMHREIELAKRYDVPLSVILMDIDHFKRINDTYGHLHGDMALRAVANITRETIRESDILFRYGGEEFLILLTNTDSDGAQLLAERIRESIQSITPIPETNCHVTVSLGVTTLLDEDDQHSLFKRSDKALYQAKNSGRNRVVYC